MNLALAEILRVIDQSRERMTIVRETCCFCGGSGTAEVCHGSLITVQKCRACNGHGRISVERISA